MMAATTLTVTARKRWWFTPFKFCLMAWVFVTGRIPSDAWIGKWAARAVRFEVK